MASIPFNGVTVTFQPAGAQGATTLKVRNHSESGNDRPDIDVTTAGDLRRVVVPGLAGAQKHTFEVLVQTAAERGTVMGWLAECTAGTLTVQTTVCGDAQPSTILTDDAWCTGVTYTGDLDGVWTYSIEFTVDHS